MESDIMSVYMIKSEYYSRVFIGKTADKPNKPEKDGDVFIDLTADKKYVGYGGTWNETSQVW